jgi:hypothetical protein
MASSMNGRGRRLSVVQVSPQDDVNSSVLTCCALGDEHARSRLSGRIASPAGHVDPSQSHPMPHPYNRQKRTGTYLESSKQIDYRHARLGTGQALHSPTSAPSQLAGFTPSLPYVRSAARSPSRVSPGRDTRSSPEAEMQSSAPAAERERYVSLAVQARKRGTDTHCTISHDTVRNPFPWPAQTARNPGIPGDHERWGRSVTTSAMTSNSFSEVSHRLAIPGAAHLFEKAAISCNQCRQRKSRCDGVQPNPCSACVKRGTGDECSYVAHVRRRGPGKVKTQETGHESNEMRTEGGETGLRRSFTVDGSQMDEPHGATRRRDDDRGTPGLGAKRLRTASPGGGGPAGAVSEERMQEE